MSKIFRDYERIEEREQNMSVYIDTGDGTRDIMIKALLSRYHLANNLNAVICGINLHESLKDGYINEENLPYPSSAYNAFIFICCESFSETSVSVSMKEEDEDIISEAEKLFSKKYEKPVFFLKEPFTFQEFFSIIENLTNSAPADIAESRSTYDWKTKTITKGDKSASLTSREAELFEFLLEKNGKEVSRDTIYNKLWQGDKQTNVADVYISYLRKKLNHVLGAGSLISIRGKGYMLKFK